jgi:hypothetical protein
MSVNAGPPAVALVGDSALSVGAGLLAVAPVPLTVAEMLLPFSDRCADAGELFGVDVQQLARPRVLVALSSSARSQLLKSRQTQAAEQPGDRRPTELHDLGDLERGLALPAQRSISTTTAALVARGEWCGRHERSLNPGSASSS